MSGPLEPLMEGGRLPPLCYYFARFVAAGAGVAEDSPVALAAALVSRRNLQGDVCVDLGDWAGRPLFAEGDGEGVVLPAGPPLDEWLAALAGCGWVGSPGREAPLVLDGRRLYLGRLWRDEQAVAAGLEGRMEAPAGLDPAALGGALARLFPPLAHAPVDWQRVAAAIVASRRFAVVSGGPGTGKTTTVVKVLALLLEQAPDLKVALAAPTGKAAARLGDAVARGKGALPAAVSARALARIPETATTVHRLLGVGGDGAFRHNRGNPLPVDCLVVDEASMVDLTLMARLVEALPGHARLVLLGDRDQLASVEAGNVLGDITGHGRELCYSPGQAAFLEDLGAAPAGTLPAAAEAPRAADAVGLLRTSYRFGDESGIGAAARAVNTGQGESALAVLQDPARDDLAWLEAGDGGLLPEGVDLAVAAYGEYLAETEVVAALAAFERFRVLAALHGGPFGVVELNRRIAARLQARGLITGGEDYHGRPVMVTVNDYEVDLYNGDIGLLWRQTGGELRAWFRHPETGARSLSLRQLPEHVTAYALTVHKSQGSEFDRVLLVLPAEPSPLLTRELVYTGLTRARSRVTVHGRPETFIAGCRARVQRSSALAERLGWPR